MAIQFTRRNQSPLRRQSSSSLPGTPENQSPVLVLNDDASEKRERRLSLMIEKQITESPRGSYNPIAHLNAVQLAEHYTNCMKLSTQNKINSKNAFQLQLIDYMAMMLKKKEPQMDNFQIASCTLDASAKIYACRVDNVYNDAFKLAAGFSRNANKKDENVRCTLEENAPDSNEPGKYKKAKRSSMIEMNPERLNVRGRESINPIDPYFRRIATKLEVGQCGGCHLLQTLRIIDDSQDYILGSHARWWRERQPEACRPSTSVSIPLPNFNAINSAEICPSLSSFTFIGWKPEMDHDVKDGDILGDLSVNKILERDAEHAFDMDAIPEVVPMDEDPELSGDVGDDLEVEKLGCVENGRKSSFEYVSLRNSLSHEPQEYSYFQKAAQVGWSGPAHWKVGPILRKKHGERVPARKNSKGRSSLEYDDHISEVDFKISQKRVCLKNCTIDSWSDLGTTLPPDLNIYPSALLRLFLKPHMNLKTKNTSTIVEGLNPFNFDNTNDLEDYCPNLEMDDPISDDSLECFGMDLCKLPDMEMLGAAESGYDLVPAPYMVPMYRILYAQQAKRLNMKKLQELMYKIMTTRENVQEEVTVDSQEPEGLRGIFKFTDVYKKVSRKLPAKEAKNLSIQIAFVALLHIASSKSLHLRGSDDLADITISKETN